MSKKRMLYAAATLIGCIIGAGILGLPGVVARAGFLTGALNIVVIGLLFLLINLYLGEVVLRTEGTHQLVHYARKYLGHTGQRIMFFSLAFGIYGAAIAYLIGQGSALSSIFGWNPIAGSTLAFAVLGFIVYAGIGAIEKAESIAVPLVIVIVIIVSFLALPMIEPRNLEVFDFRNIFIPYGVVFFAFFGTSAIPSMKQELKGHFGRLRQAIILGSLIPIGIYLLFSLSLVGVFGSGVQEVASLSFGGIIGSRYAYLGGVFAILTMSTSYLVLGMALKDVFMRDYGLKKSTSWFLSCGAPYLMLWLLYFAKMASFEMVLDFTGVIMGVIIMVMTILMAYNAKKKSERKPEYTVFLNKPLAITLITFIILGGVLKLLL